MDRIREIRKNVGEINESMEGAFEDWDGERRGKMRATTKGKSKVFLGWMGFESLVLYRNIQMLKCKCAHLCFGDGWMGGCIVPRTAN